MIRLALALALVLSPAAAAAQESEVSRRSFTFIHDRLVVTVVGGSAGGLQILRGQPGRVEVAARSRDGFPGFGLGGTMTRELRLTAPGAEHVQFLVVVPERVTVTVRLPDGRSAQPPTSGDVASYAWGTGEAPQVTQLPLMPTTANGLYLIHSTRWAPSVVDVPELDAIRSLAVRFEGSEFRIAASRPLSMEPGSNSRFSLRVSGDMTDIVIYVPRGSAAFQLRSGDTPLAELMSGRPRALCGNVAIQTPTRAQDWLTFYPRDGALDCR